MVEVDVKTGSLPVNNRSHKVCAYSDKYINECLYNLQCYYCVVYLTLVLVQIGALVVSW